MTILRGGLNDRIRGMVNLFYYCSTHKTKEGSSLNFKIYHNSPFRLENYLEPNEYDWVADENMICRNQNDVFSLFIGIDRTAFIKSWDHAYDDEAGKRNCAYAFEAINYFRMHNKQKQFHIWTNNRLLMFYPETYSAMFHKLFRPNDRIIQEVNRIKQHIGGKYISMTLRFQNLLGDFNEGSYPTLSLDEQDELISKCIKKIYEIYKSEEDSIRVLVTADSKRFLDVIEDTYAFVTTIPGRRVHMGYTDEDDFELHLTPFVDYFTIADAYKVYLLVTGKMYHSDFAGGAARINQRPYEIIEF